MCYFLSRIPWLCSHLHRSDSENPCPSGLDLYLSSKPPTIGLLQRANLTLKSTLTEQRYYKNTFTYRATILLAVSICLYITTTVIMAVPANVDESIQYHPIACDFYPNAKYHTFWNPCDHSTDLVLFGVHFKRSYNYIGGLSSYLYYPFFRMYPSILTQRLFGVVFLFLFIGILILLEKENKLAVIVLFGLSVPLVYQTVDDTGPVRYALFITAFTAWLVRHIGSLKQGWLNKPLNVLLGCLLFLAVEEKPFFLYLIPSVLLLTVAYNIDNNQAVAIVTSVRRVLRQMWLALVIFAGLTCLYLLAAKTSGDDLYIVSLTKSVKPYQALDVFKNILSYMTNLQKFSSMVFDSGQLRWLNIGLSVSIWLVGIVCILKAGSFKLRLLPRKIVFTSLGFIVSVCSFLITRNAWSGHHFIFPYVFALLIVCQAMSNINYPVLALYSLCSLILATELWFLVPGPTSSWERYKIFEFLQREAVGNNYVVAHLSIGTYYIASLYGAKNQLSLQIKSLDDKTARAIMNLSDRLKREILCVCRGSDCSAHNLSDGFQKRIQFEEINLKTKDWKVFRGI